MSVARWLETDSLSNQNIASAAAIGAYTADADRMVVVDVSLDQVAGNGDYVIYVTRQINGAGSAYVLLPKTTCTAASGETAIAMQSGPISVRSGDVLTCYVDGLAGDTATPDTTVRWFEVAALQPTVAGRALAVDAGGNASANVTLWKSADAGAIPAAAPSAAAIRTEMDSNSTKLANLDATVSSRLAAASYTAPLDAAGVRTAVGLATANLDTQLAGLPTDADVQAAAAAALTAYDPPTDTEMDAGLALLATSAALVVIDANVDAIKLVTDAIDVSEITLAPVNVAGHLTITTALTFETQISGLVIPVDWISAVWSLKRSRRDLDTASLVKLVESNPGVGTDGLAVLNGAAPVSPLTAASGALTINVGAGTATVQLTDDLTAQLATRSGLIWGLKFLRSNGDSKEYAGTADVELSVTHGI